jgi:hypothetical protein
VSNPRSWLSKHQPNNQQVKKKSDAYGTVPPDAPLREGENVSDKLFEIWDKAQAANTYLTGDDLDELKTKCGSVNKPPLLISRHKELAAPMHTPQGSNNHFFAAFRTKLGQIDGEVDDVKVNLQHIHRDVINSMKEVKIIEKKQSVFTSSITKLKNRIEAAKKNGESALGLERKLEEKLRQRQEPATENCLSVQRRLLSGASYLKKSMDSWFKSGNGFGEASHLFHEGLQIFGASYNAEHGGTELSHGDTIDTLEVWDEITGLVVKAYTKVEGTYQAQIIDDDVNPLEYSNEELSTKVRRVVGESKVMAEDLLTLSKQLKSQEKRAEEDVKIIKDAALRFWTNWLAWHPDKYEPPVKIHNLCMHFPEFVEAFQMIGVLSEEGQESMHPEINSQKARIRGLGSMKARVRCMHRRLVTRSHPETRAVKDAFNKSKKQTANRPKKYKTDGRRKNINDSHKVQSDDITEDPKGYLMFDDHVENGLIKKEWLLAYDVCIRQKVPLKFHRHINAMNIGNVQKELASTSCN